MEIKMDLKNLNNAYVICKKFNGKIYFRTSYTNDSRNAENARIYWNRADADKALEFANNTRKRVKYFIEPASMYFINDFQYGLDYWGNEAVLNNKPFPLVKLQEKNLKFTKLTKEVFYDKVNKDIDAQIVSKKEYLQRLAKETEVTIQNMEIAREKFKAIDVDKLISEYGTKAETTAMILYGSKE